MKLHLWFAIVSGLAFIFYGLLIILSNHMKREFERYGMTRFRTLTGYLEVAGGAGQLVGMSFLPLLLFASSGLALLMLLGVIVRLRTKDPILEILPAAGLMLLNISIVLAECL